MWFQDNQTQSAVTLRQRSGHCLQCDLHQEYRLLFIPPCESGLLWRVFFLKTLRPMKDSEFKWIQFSCACFKKGAQPLRLNNSAEANETLWGFWLAAAETTEILNWDWRIRDLGITNTEWELKSFQCGNLEGTFVLSIKECFGHFALMFHTGSEHFLPLIM